VTVVVGVVVVVRQVGKGVIFRGHLKLRVRRIELWKCITGHDRSIFGDCDLK
jgi:hypothetical protein